GKLFAVILSLNIAVFAMEKNEVDIIKQYQNNLAKQIQKERDQYEISKSELEQKAQSLIFEQSNEIERLTEKQEEKNKFYESSINGQLNCICGGNHHQERISQLLQEQEQTTQNIESKQANCMKRI